MIIQRLKNTSVSVPFAEVSRFAKEAGRRDLAALVRSLMYMHFHNSVYIHSAVDNSRMFANDDIYTIYMYMLLYQNEVVTSYHHISLLHTYLNAF